MKYSRLPSNEELWAFAKLLHQMHENHEHVRCDPEPTREYKGLLGQRRLAYLTGGVMDMRILPGGDGHLDQWLDTIHGRYPADVKTARWPKDLIVSVDQMSKVKRKTIFILAQLLNAEADKMEWDAELLVWNWDSELRKSEPKDYGFGIMNYWIPRNECRDIYELLALVERKWGLGA
jgi:hypothetical protein